MKKSYKLLGLLFCIGFFISIQNTKAHTYQNKPRTVTINKLPTSVEEFLEMRNKISTTPEGGAATMLVALMLYSKNPSLGLPCLTIAIDKQWLESGSGGYKGYVPGRRYLGRIKEQLKRYPYLPFSYVEGTRVANGYKMPSGKLTFNISTNPYSGDEKLGLMKLFAASSGAKTPRPIKVRRNNRGIWKADEWSSIIMGIQTPKVEVDDDL